MGGGSQSGEVVVRRGLRRRRRVARRRRRRERPAGLARGRVGRERARGAADDERRRVAGAEEGGLGFAVARGEVAGVREAEGPAAAGVLVVRERARLVAEDEVRVAVAVDVEDRRARAEAAVDLRAGRVEEPADELQLFAVGLVVLEEPVLGPAPRRWGLLAREEQRARPGVPGARQGARVRLLSRASRTLVARVSYSRLAGRRPGTRRGGRGRGRRRGPRRPARCARRSRCPCS